MSDSQKTYTLTQQDYDVLMSAALNNPTALGVLQRIANNTHEILNDDKVAELFGQNFHGIIYYNFDTKRWNRDTYFGKKIRNQSIDTTHACELKKRVEESPDMREIEIVATVAMPIDIKDYPGWSQTIENPIYEPHGESVVATVIRRDRRTGKILPIPSQWMGVRQSRSSVFVFNGFRYWDFRRIFNEIHGIQK